MNFSLPRFLRRTQSSDLQTYFTARDIPFSERVDWTAKPGAFLDSLKAAIERLPDQARERVFEDFERVDQLSDEIRQRVLQSFIEHDEALLQKFHFCNGSEARGLFVLLTDEGIFDHALATAYAERMRHGAIGIFAPKPDASSSKMTPLRPSASILIGCLSGPSESFRLSRR
jgi:hypothetical protein